MKGGFYRDRRFLLVAAANAVLMLHDSMLFILIPLWIVQRGGLSETVSSTLLLLNTAITLWLREDGRHDINIRSAVLHMLGDAVSSAGIIAAALLIRFTGALFRAQRWLARASATEVAALIAPAFPDVPAAIRQAAVARYQAQGTWAADPILRAPGYEYLQQILLDGGFISRRHRYEDLIDTTLASAVVEASAAGERQGQSHRADRAQDHQP